MSAPDLLAAELREIRRKRRLDRTVAFAQAAIFFALAVFGGQIVRWIVS